MRLKGQNGKRTSLIERAFTGNLEQRVMTTMQRIEITDGDNRSAGIFR
jgi:hypothetical protein